MSYQVGTIVNINCVVALKSINDIDNILERIRYAKRNTVITSVEGDKYRLAIDEGKMLWNESMFRHTNDKFY